METLISKFDSVNYNPFPCSSRHYVKAASFTIQAHNIQNSSKDCQLLWCLTKILLSHLSVLNPTPKGLINSWIKRESQLILLTVKTCSEVSYVT
jgi:hypothetical protein